MRVTNKEAVAVYTFFVCCIYFIQHVNLGHPSEFQPCHRVRLNFVTDLVVPLFYVLLLLSRFVIVLLVFLQAKHGGSITKLGHISSP